jgi:hypothetical protein
MTIREFFIELLRDENLQWYYSDRDGYIDTLVERGELSSDDGEFLKTASLAAVEQKLLEASANPGRPSPLFIVCPPM